MKHSAIRIGYVTSILCLLQVAGCKKSASPDDSSGVKADQAETTKPAPPEHRKTLSFVELDRNKDGQLTADEAGDMWKDISEADTNNDGIVTKQELGAFHPKPSN